MSILRIKYYCTFLYEKNVILKGIFKELEDLYEFEKNLGDIKVNKDLEKLSDS